MQPATPAGIKTLNLEGNAFERLPPSLAAATGLTSLSFAGNSRLQLSAANVTEVLPGMQRLWHLKLDASPPPEVMHLLRQRRRWLWVHT